MTPEEAREEVLARVAAIRAKADEAARKAIAEHEAKRLANK